MSTCTCPPGTLLGMPITPHRDCPIHGRPRGPITTDPTDLTPADEAAVDWLDARDKYETETREQLRALVNRHGMADRTCLISDNTTE